MGSTAKESAKELIDRFKKVLHDPMDILKVKTTDLAKKCAKEAVFVIIKDLNQSLQVAKDLHPQASGLIVGSIVHWNDVLTEIDLYN